MGSAASTEHIVLRRFGLAVAGMQSGCSATQVWSPLSVVWGVTHPPQPGPAPTVAAVGIIVLGLELRKRQDREQCPVCTQGRALPIPAEGQ